MPFDYGDDDLEDHKGFDTDCPLLEENDGRQRPLPPHIFERQICMIDPHNIFKRLRSDNEAERRVAANK